MRASHLSGLFAIALCGCAGDDGASAPSPAPPAATGQSTPTPAPTSSPAAQHVYPSASESTRLAALDQFWTSWKSIYLKEGCGGAYVDVSGDGKPAYGGSAPDTLTVSEAHGYGMLALVLMADRDPEAKLLFDKMVTYFLAHQTAAGEGLMSWNQTRDCKDAPDGGDTSATDGDLDIALALQLADARWGGYGDAAAKVRSAILARETTADGMMRLGDWAVEAPYDDASRSSDFMPGSFYLFASADSGEAAAWTKIRDRGDAVWGDLSAAYAPDTGLVPDFLVGLPDDPKPASPNFLEGENDGNFSWNAFRYPWRLSLDLLASDDARAASRLIPINAWIMAKTDGVPAQIATSYRLDGTVLPDQSGQSAAFIAMFAASAVAGSGDAAADQKWMDALWADLNAIPAADEDYFGNTLKLLSMMELAGLWPK
ncbi:glycosyl hydrolase family 8 [Parasphingorhabdus sp.]|uniref:glycosyl hydrolase family 8 n=1 Tax=Parasphingorhabdus sp. TaxID=2709688 RepID=UPI003A8E0998